MPCVHPVPASGNGISLSMVQKAHSQRLRAAFLVIQDRGSVLVKHNDAYASPDYRAEQLRDAFVALSRSFDACWIGHLIEVYRHYDEPALDRWEEVCEGRGLPCACACSCPELSAEAA